MSRTYALGKTPPRYDRRTAKLARYVNLSVLPAAPNSTGARYKAVTDYGLWKNDKVGDCGVVGQGNAEKSWTHWAGNADEVGFTDDDIISAYSQISGYDPATGANDNGVNLLDALNHWRNTGLTDAAGVVHKIGAYVAVDLKNEELTRSACWIFDGLYVGYNLPATAQNQVGAGNCWTPEPQTGSQAYPGSWGGHCVWTPDYDDDKWSHVTWAMIQQADDKFWDAYCDEAYAIVSADYLHGSKSVEGFDAEALAADLPLVA